jgi:hypothetical protein
MSLAPRTDDNLYNRVFRAKKLPSYSEKQYATGDAAKDIEKQGAIMRANEGVKALALDAFFTIHTRRGTDVYENNVIMILDRENIDISAVKITSILKAVGGYSGNINWDGAASLIDYAIWGLMAFVSENSAHYAMADGVAAYVMRELLFPMKVDTMKHDCGSLLYKTVRYSDFKFGRAVFAAVVSRNDQLFRASELEDTGTIRLFEERYSGDLVDSFKAKPPLVYK